MQEFTVVISDEGEIGFFAANGTYEEGKANIEKMIALLQADGAEFSAIGKVEQHAHSKEMASLHDKAHDIQP